MLHLWQDIWRMQKDQPLQGGVQVNAETAAKQKTSRSSRLIHDIRQDKETQITEQEQCRSFNLVKIKYVKFDNVKFIIFSTLEVCTTQKRTHNKKDSRHDGN